MKLHGDKQQQLNQGFVPHENFDMVIGTNGDEE